MPKTPAEKSTPESLIRRARRVATTAINQAAQIAADEEVNRSTRTRAAFKLKAEALDQVARILAGKE